MSITATNNGKKKELVPAGNYIARCYQMIHLGTATEEIMGEKKTMNKVRISWELPTELRVFDEAKGEQPMAISKEYTLSMHEKSTLRHDLESWRGKAFTEEQAKSFDITKLLGVPCMLNIIHRLSKKGDAYATIASVSSMPKGMTAPGQVNDNFEWNFTDKYSPVMLETFPDFIKDRIKSSDEYRAMTSPIEDLTNREVDESFNGQDDDLPF